MLIEKISAEELKLMDTYRRWYAWNNEASQNTANYTPIEEILSAEKGWQEAKSKYLFNLFGGELILRKKVNYQKSKEELGNELEEMMEANASLGRIGRNGHVFTRAWGDFRWRMKDEMNFIQQDALSHLLSNDCLTTNIYDGGTVEFITPSGKSLKINSGCKASKALGKIATAFNLPGFEDFRICHSQILNQRELGGELVISIHPLDYMTMSDNECGWDSCMNWRDEGGYRQGTVEMMNSPSVIVAYLESNQPMMPCGRMDGSWNNKKWRQLFVVDKNVIIGVKSYPYENEEISNEVVRWLKELAANNLKWEYKDIITVDFETPIFIEGQDSKKDGFLFHFSNNNMYNDFGCANGHQAVLSKNLNVDDINWNYSCSYGQLRVTYSGASQCMICGEIYPCLSDEGCLACEGCQERLTCDACGEYVGEVWSIDGMQLCEYCWENRVKTCDICGDEHLEENSYQIYVLPRLTAEEQEELKRKYYEDGYDIWGPTRNPEDYVEFNYFIDHSSFCVCDHGDCFSNFKKTYLKPGCRPHYRKMRWDCKICVYFDELSEYGMEELGCWDTNDEFKKKFRYYSPDPTSFIDFI